MGYALTFDSRFGDFTRNAKPPPPAMREKTSRLTVLIPKYDPDDIGTRPAGRRWNAALLPYVALAPQDPLPADAACSPRS